ncbi:Peroxisomal and mitochondrial division factor 2 [Spatholobus suberectus]|nr:Peroxisomal and mitochondrial division factor 2 [Spatholobus suberectus]
MQREVVGSCEAVKAAEKVIVVRAADLKTKVVKAGSEVSVRDLERKIGVLETKEIEEWNKRIRFKEEMRDKIGEKEKEINLSK